jgi:phi LC3 family holin
MKINWTVRLKNKVFLASALALIVSFAYDWLALLGYAPALTESVVMSVVDGVLTALVAIGVIVDPTTAGTSDSVRALTYDKPV